MALWLRRGAGVWLVPAILLLLGAGAVGNRAWVLDAGWGMRYTAGAVILVAPLVAALTAYDTARHVAPGLSGVARASVRGRRAELLPMIAVVLYALTATATCWVAIIVMSVSLGGIAPADPWVWIEMVSVYVAAGAVGVVVAARTPTVVAVALSAGAVFVLASVLGSQGVKALQVAMSTGTMLGLERTPARAMLAIAVNLGIAVTALALHALQTSPRRARAWTMAVAAVPALMVLVVHLTYPFQDSEYRPSRTPAACWGTAPTVCGPANAAALLQTAQLDLAAARASLRASGLPLPATFNAARTDRFTTIGTAAALPIDPATLVDGHLPDDTIVEAYASPRQCAALFSEASAPEYLALISTTTEWLRSSLTTRSTAAAPDQVHEAYLRLSTCPVPSPEQR